MFRCTWVPLFTELHYYDQKLTTHHAHNKHTHHNQPEFNTPIIFYAIAMISGTFPPTARIIIVGLIESNNGCQCDLHPDGYGNSLVLERADHGVGMELRLRMKVSNKLACYSIRTDGTDGCCVAFAAKEYAVGEKGGNCPDCGCFFT